MFDDITFDPRFCAREDAERIANSDRVAIEKVRDVPLNPVRDGPILSVDKNPLLSADGTAENSRTCAKRQKLSGIEDGGFTGTVSPDDEVYPSERIDSDLTKAAEASNM